MNDTKKLVYSASCTAIAVVSMLISRYFPFLSFTPLLLCSLCFFIALECRLIYGLLCITASLILGFFVTAGINFTFLFTALIFAPYSILAYIIKKLNYNTIKSAFKRASVVSTVFNIPIAILFFLLGKYLGDFLFGLNINEIFSIFPHKIFGYIIIPSVCVMFMLGFDYLFVTAIPLIKKRLGFNV